MKKITIYKIIFVMLVILAIFLLGIIAKDYIQDRGIENKAQDVLEAIKTKEVSNPELDIIEEIDAEIDGYKVIGIIEIPKINIEYPILEKTNEESLKLSITKFWGNKINEIGNVVLAGHNNLNDKMFGKINKLTEGDIIELTDYQMVTIQYEVFKTYIVDPNDITCIVPEEDDVREVTLITCTNGAKERLVVKAREINNSK